MVSGRLYIMATLVQVLGRLEGRVVIAYATRNPAAFLSLSSAVPPHNLGASRRSSSRNRATDTASTTHIIFQRRKSRAVGHAQGGVPVAGVRAHSTNSGGLASTGGASAEVTMEDARQALKSLFGHEDFRDGQVGVHGARSRVGWL